MNESRRATFRAGAAGRAALVAGVAVGALMARSIPERQLGIHPAWGVSCLREFVGAERAHRYWLPVAAGESIRIEAEQKGSDVLLEIALPDGRTFIADSPTEVLGTDRFEFVSEQSGTVGLKVDLLKCAGVRCGYAVTSNRQPASDRARERARIHAEIAKGDRLQGRGDLVQARAAYRSAAANARRVDASEVEALALLQLGYLDAENPSLEGAAAEAVSVTLRAAAVTRSDGFRLMVWRVAVRSLLMLGRHGEAAEIARRAVSLAEGMPGFIPRTVAFSMAADAAESHGDFQRAIAWNRKALDLWRAQGSPVNLAEALVLMANNYVNLGSPQNAEAPLREALDLLPPGDLARVRVLLSLAKVDRDFGRFDQARVEFEEALAIAEAHRDLRSQASTLVGLGALELVVRRNPEARSYLERARAILDRVPDRSVEANAESCLGVVESRDDRPQLSFEHFRRAAAAYHAMGAGNYEAWVLSHFADAQRAAGDLHAARRSMETAIARIEDVRRNTSSSTARADLLSFRHGIFERLVDLLMELDHREPGRGYRGAAFDAAERARARTLLDEVTGSALPPAPSALAEIQMALPPATALVSYALGADRSFGWLVDSRSIEVAQLPAKETIELLAEKVAASLGAPPSGLETVRRDQDRNLSLLSAMLLGGFVPGRQLDRMVVVPDGGLFSVPFAALPWPGLTGADPDRLIDRLDVVTLPSASVALALRRDRVSTRPSRSLVVAFGDPVFSPSDERLGGTPGREGMPSRGGQPTVWSRLPGTRREVETIRSLVGPARGRFFLDFDANRRNAIAAAGGNSRVLHFATHAWIDPTDPLRSGLVLSTIDRSGRQHDGLLRIGDLRPGALKAELVVVSSCRSAVGPEVRGEGPISLGRGFLAAGAGGAVVSLWQVGDRSTADLMANFYHALLGRGLDPAAALREAQLALKADPPHRDPFYWASFVYQGDWR